MTRERAGSSLLDRYWAISNIPLFLSHFFYENRELDDHTIPNDQSQRIPRTRLQPCAFASKGSGFLATSSSASRSGISARFTNLVPLMTFQSTKAASTSGMSLEWRLASCSNRGLGGALGLTSRTTQTSQSPNHLS